MSIDFEKLWRHVAAQFYTRQESVHGVDHWRRVERNGLLLATQTGADEAVVRLFALFHDSKRENEGSDPDHGPRGAGYAASLRGKMFELPDAQFDLLHYACSWHTRKRYHHDPTIATCWDADRLDLGRVGITPRAEFMSTEFGKKIADRGEIEPFLVKAGMHLPRRK